MSRVISAVLILLPLWLAGCQSAPEAPVSSEPEADSDAPAVAVTDDDAKAVYDMIEEYRIGVDDVVLVSVWGNENLTIQVPVRPDGRISVPLVGDLMVGGQTPEAVSRVIEQKLTAFVRDPKVSVILIELNSHEFITRVRVTGAVRAPASLPYRQGMTVLDLVLLAGGPNEFAAPNRARLYRRASDASGAQQLDVDLDDILLKGKLDTNYRLLPGDVVTVPERLF